MNVIFGDAPPMIALVFFDFVSAACWLAARAGTIDSVGGLMVVPVVLFGIGPLMIAHVFRRLPALRLLRSGVVAYATLRKRAPIVHTDFKMDRLHFTFEHRGQTYDVTTDATYEAAQPIVDDPQEQIVFRPGEEQHAVFIDRLPGRPRIREDNSIDPRPHVLGAVTATVLLAAAVEINVFGAWLWLR